MIGHIQLHSKDGLNNNCKIAYVIGYDFRKKGYAREAVRAVLNFGLSIANYHRIDDYYDQRVYTLIKKEDKKRVNNG